MVRRARKVEKRLRLVLTRLVCWVLAFRLAANKDDSRFLAKALWSSVGRDCLWFRTSWRVRSGSASRVWRRWAGHMRSCRSEVKIKIREQRCFRSRHSKTAEEQEIVLRSGAPFRSLVFAGVLLASRRTIKSTSTLAKNAGRAGAQGLSLQSSDTLVISFSNVPLLSVRLDQPDQSDEVALLCLGCVD